MTERIVPSTSRAARSGAGARRPAVLFRAPWHRDGLFWYAVAVLVLTYLALAVMGTGLAGIEGHTVGGFVANVVIGWSIAFVVLVLPAALIRHALARRRMRRS